MMTKKDRKKIATMLLERGRECYTAAIEGLEEALAELRNELGDGEKIESGIVQAMSNVHEARGFFNAAADVEEQG